jgi:hypothetical protein
VTAACVFIVYACVEHFLYRTFRVISKVYDGVCRSVRPVCKQDGLFVELSDRRAFKSVVSFVHYLIGFGSVRYIDIHLRYQLLADTMNATSRYSANTFVSSFIARRRYGVLWRALFKDGGLKSSCSYFRFVMYYAVIFF